jgi:hypothetical protein
VKKYIWLNPVVLKMYDQEELHSTLESLGFQIVTCEENHLKIVKDKYKERYEGCKNLLCDNRCPKAISYVRTHYDHTSLEYSSIQPILIHCAEELANRYKDDDAELYIITPCTDLRDLGNKLALKNTIFQTWTQFCREHHIRLNSKPTENSPIPPGFFDNIPNVVSLASKDDMDRFFQDTSKQDKQLIEMLYCQGGCHNGDGVRITNE